MAGAMRKMAVYLGLVEDDRYDDRYVTEYANDEDYADDDYESARRGFSAGGQSGQAVSQEHDEDGDTSIPAPRPSTAVLERRTTDLARITTLHPRTYNEARTIGEHYREGTPVIMNLTEMVDSDAKRLVDFAAGLVFGLHGSIERVTNKVFLLSPANVEVTAEDKARIAERGFFNQS
ncbi:cell division protein SepF [Microtetraspora malaysiensis]|uniref:Cell division protein SepF n=1 Tax=Microtetraspora malaysiensis TaxID=161358 RepID=A0ABW6SIH6_9ACTN|nr:cell division protein SepF [Microtetraspora malaysiensis]